MSSVNTASNASNATAGNGGFNAVGTALSQPGQQTQTNFGSGQFVNTTPQNSASATGNAFNTASGVLGNFSSMNNAAQSAGASMANATAPSSYLGAVCCFIFLEAYHGKLPKCVRRGRDKYYQVNHDIATGYRKMAAWLVPLMNSNFMVRWLVWQLIVSPITDHLEAPKRGWKKQITHFWLRVWSMMGRGHCEIEYRKAWMYV